MPPTIHEITRDPSRLDELIKGKARIDSTAGKQLVLTRLRQIGSAAPNGQPIAITRLLRIRKGDPVPVVFRGISGLKVTPAGLAAGWYTDGWCQSHWNQSGGWGDIWGECWDNSGPRSNFSKSILVINSLNTKVKAFSISEFSPQELEVLSKFHIS